MPKAGWRRWVPSRRVVLWSFGGGFGLVVAVFTVGYLSVDIPLENKEARQQATDYYWADGSHMVSVGAVHRRDISLAEIPDSVERAVVAAENEGFYEDMGVSVSGLLRALKTAVGGGDVQGGSTITQQYVKNTYLTQEQTLTRKAKEFFISLKVSREKSKDEILQGYLNTSYFGRGAYGIQAAARAYYGIPAKELDPSQAAVLAALLKGAEEYDPAGSGKNHERAVQRWAWILDRQVETGKLPKAQRDTYTIFPEPLKRTRPTSLGGQTGYLVDIANKHIKKASGLTDKDLSRGGYRIRTTFEKDGVRELEQAVQRMRAQGLDPKKRQQDQHVEVGAASVRPSDGAVTAAYGGEDAVRRFSNNADTAGVAAGSAFKPFVLAAALKHGTTKGYGVTTNSYYDKSGIRNPDDPMLPAQLELDPQATLDRASRTTLRDALVKGGGNVTYTRLGKDVGPQNVKDTAVAAGLHEASMPRPEAADFPRGTSTPSAIRMASAYTTFGNDGQSVEPYSVTRVERDGHEIPGFARPVRRSALPPELALEVHSTLLDVGGAAMARSSLSPADRLALGPVAAGRTGKDDHLQSAWFVGRAKDLTTAVALFRTKPDVPQLLPMRDVGGPGTEHGNALAQRVWETYTSAALRSGGPQSDGPRSP
ncbi:transglycosylase domain-containing protein [Streptomyces sp. NPDC058657]|uniref:transglycosylase domain-containing protein n=1 Tax=unclassified Streptomyces TaxID=2593676 RepID=UPI0036484AB3